MIRYTRWFVVFFLGMIAGASITNMLIGVQIDHLDMNNSSLRQQLSTCERELQSVKENLAERQREVITGVDTKINFTGEELTEYEKNSASLEIEKQVEEWLEIIEGQEVSEVDYMLIPEIIDEREVNVDNRKLLLKTQLIVVTETVIVNLEASPVKEESGE